MPITIYFNNTKKPVTGEVLLYRTDGVINKSSPGTPIATFTAAAFHALTTYVDANGDPANPKYYTLGIKNGSSIVFSASVRAGENKGAGPGPATLMCGNSRDGYYGPLPITELPESESWYPRPACKWNGNNVTTFSDGVQVAHKFVRNGKIFYAVDPRAFVCTVDIQKLRTSGYATNGLIVPGKTQPIMDYTTSARGFRYRARMVRAFPDNWDGSLDDIGALVTADTELNFIANVVFGQWQGKAKSAGNPKSIVDKVAFRTNALWASYMGTGFAEDAGADKTFVNLDIPNVTDYLVQSVNRFNATVSVSNRMNYVIVNRYVAILDLVE